MNKNKILRFPAKRWDETQRKVIDITREFFLNAIECVSVFDDDSCLIYMKKDISISMGVHNTPTRRWARSELQVSQKIFDKLHQHLEPYIAEVVEITEDD